MSTPIHEIRQQLEAAVTEQRGVVDRMARELKRAKQELRVAERLLKRWAPVGSGPTGPVATLVRDGEKIGADKLIESAVISVLKREGSMPPGLLWQEVRASADLDTRKRVINALVDARKIEIRGKAGGTRVALAGG